MYSSPSPEVNRECGVCGSTMILVEEIPTISEECCSDTFVCQNSMCGRVEPKVKEVYRTITNHYI